MTSLLALRILLFLGECFLASTVVLASAWVATAFLERASLRHMAWLTAFGVMLVLPVVALIVPPRIVVEHRDAQTQSIPVTVEAVAPAAAATPVAAAPAPWSPDLRDIALGILGSWLIGALWAARRLAAGALGLAALRRGSRPFALASADLPAVEARGRECELRLSVSQSGPMTWGVLRPVVLLPKNAVAWPRRRLHAVLLHELAHVRRRDSFTQSLSLLACALYWPNPLAWIGARALRREAEMAADDAVVVSGIRPSDYAGELLQLACEFRGRRAAPAGVSMASPSALEARVKSVLAPDRIRRGVTSMEAIKIACIGLAAAALLALARPDVVAAQDARADASAPADPATPPDAPAPDATAPVEAPAPVEAVPAPPAVPAMQAVAPKTAHDRHHHHVHIVDIEKDGRVVRIDRAQVDEAVAQARQAAQEIRRAEPEIERAIAAAKIDETVAKALESAEPRVRAEVARAMAKARPAIRKALADAHIGERVAKALRDAQPRIDAAIAKAQYEADKADRKMDEKIDGENRKVEIEDGADNADDSTDDEGK